MMEKYLCTIVSKKKKKIGITNIRTVASNIPTNINFTYCSFFFAFYNKWYIDNTYTTNEARSNIFVRINRIFKLRWRSLRWGDWVNL